MRILNIACAAALGLGVFAATTASAATVSIQTFETDAVVMQHGIRADTGTTGADLGGMVVTAGYADGSSESLTWAAFDNRYNFGGASGTGFDIEFGWRYFEVTTQTAIHSLTFEAGLGNAIFDLHTPGGHFNTPGTKGGFDFYLDSSDTNEGEVAVSYSGAVTLAGSERGIDTFTTMMIDFTGLEGGALTDMVRFNSDLDSLLVAGDLTPVDVANVPLPAGLPLLLAGLGLLGLQRRKSR